MSRIAFLFPGQGAQKAGMGKDFYEKSETARRIYDLGSEAAGVDLKKLCFEENDMLDLTEYTQAALTATSIAMARCLEERGIKPCITAGLSLGEYSAIALAGGFSDVEAIALVKKRGEYMEHAVPAGKGAMAAVLGMKCEEISAVLEQAEGVYIANYNCPGQTVITGEKTAVEDAAERLRKNGAKKVVMLKVSGPFHSPLLTEAKNRMETELKNISLSQLKLPYVTNVTAEKIEDTEYTKQLLAEQVCSPVLWQQSMEGMIRDGIDTFVEVGPGKTLSGFMRKIDKNIRMFNVGTWEEMESIVKELTGEIKNGQ